MAFGKRLELVAQCVKRFNEGNKETPKKPQDRFSRTAMAAPNKITHSDLMANALLANALLEVGLVFHVLWACLT